MAYIQTKEHFYKFLRNIIRDNPKTDFSDILTVEEYIQHTWYNEKLLDSFTWEVKFRPEILNQDKFFEWLKKNKYRIIPDFSDYESKVSKELIKMSEYLFGMPGIYSFWTEKETVLYIGKSENLGSRILTSFNDRFLNHSKELYMKYVITNTISDACVLEIFLITKLKPSLNVESHYDDKLTFDITHQFEFSSPILCNTINFLDHE